MGQLVTNIRTYFTTLLPQEIGFYKAYIALYN